MESLLVSKSQQATTNLENTSKFGTGSLIIENEDKLRTTQQERNSINQRKILEGSL